MMFRKQSIAVALAYMTRTTSAFTPSSLTSTGMRTTVSNYNHRAAAAAAFQKIVSLPFGTSSATSRSSSTISSSTPTMLRADVDEAAEPIAASTSDDDVEASGGVQQQEQADDLNRVVYVVNLSYGKNLIVTCLLRLERGNVKLILFDLFSFHLFLVRVRMNYIINNNATLSLLNDNYYRNKLWSGQGTIRSIRHGRKALHAKIQRIRKIQGNRVRHHVL